MNLGVWGGGGSCGRVMVYWWGRWKEEEEIIQ